MTAILSAHHRLLLKVGGVPRHIYTLWLFVVSDITSIVLPSTAFALCQALAEERIGAAEFARRLPWTLSWITVNLLAFSINNQRRQTAIQEDRHNKPWRPLPSNRLSPVAARRLGWCASGLAVCSGSLVGGGSASGVSIATSSFLYNDCGLGNGHWPARNILNASGIASFAAGALSVTQQSPLSRAAASQLNIMMMVIATTIHAQDMYDQDGDERAGRQTLPLVMGDSVARWMIAVPVLFWSAALCKLYESGTFGHMLILAIGLLISGRTLMKRATEDDRTTFLLYNAWLMIIYALPSMAR